MTDYPRRETTQAAEWDADPSPIGYGYSLVLLVLLASAFALGCAVGFVYGSLR